MSKHTTGPWRPGITGDSVVSDAEIESGPQGCDSTEYYGGHLIGESIAKCNIPLIVAAPDLLEALEMILESRIQEKGAWNWKPGKSPLHDRCRAAIAKARGEA